MPDIAGKIVAGDARRYGTEGPLEKLQSLKPALILLMARRQQGRGGADQAFLEDSASSDAPVLRIANADASTAVAGGKTLSVSLHLSAPAMKVSPVENVIGVLPGSDPVLRNQYVILSAHYDHLGVRGSQIYNGANDNGSGTVSVIEIASALAALSPHPKRTIIFVTFFGEEEGLLGAYFYTHHPLFPLGSTIANINLEQMGRTDSNAGPEISNATLTGFRYSSMARTLQQAGEATGVKVYETPNGDEYFDRSDNQTFAEHGIPAHTMAVTLEFPDYHATGDVWQKIDYGNMAKVDRMIALGIVMLADSPSAPRWNRGNPKVRQYERVLEDPRRPGGPPH